MKISVVVPVLNEALVIGQFLEFLMAEPGIHEIIVVDGGSVDDTMAIAKSWTNRPSMVHLLGRPEVLGRAHQMNWGARAASGDVLVFVHADCRLPNGFVDHIRIAMEDDGTIGGGFLKKYDPENLLLKIYRMGINGIRTRMLRNLVGTNALFIRRDLFFKIGQYPKVPILEDVLLCDRMKSAGRLAIIRTPVTCSSRRYTTMGTLRHIALAARILFLYRFRRMSLDRLKEVYANG